MANTHKYDDDVRLAIDIQLSYLEAHTTRGRTRSDRRVALELFEEDLRSCRTAATITGTKRRREEEPETNTIAPPLPPLKRMKQQKIAPKRVFQDECKACLESFPRSDLRMIRNCKCQYCDDCFTRMISSAMKRGEIARCCDRNVKPPRALKTIQAELCTNYERLFKQLDADNPMYCASPKCSAFLGNFRRLKRKVRCKTCRKESCASCRNLMSEHKGVHKLCQTDLDDSMMRRAVKKYKMRRCPKCYIVIDKNGGCMNVRCKCGTMFCYTCGEEKSGEGGPCKCYPAVQVQEQEGLFQGQQQLFGFPG